MKKLYACILPLLFVGLALTVFASPSDSGQDQGQGSNQAPVVVPGPSGFHGPMGMGEPPRLPHPFGPGLRLSREQADRMRDLENRYFDETRDLRYEISMKRLEMRRLFTDPGTSEAALYAKQKELSLVERKLHEKMAEMHIEGRKILTAEQIRKLDRAPLGGPLMPPPPPGPGPEAIRLGMLGPR